MGLAWLRRWQCWICIAVLIFCSDGIPGRSGSHTCSQMCPGHGLPPIVLLVSAPGITETPCTGWVLLSLCYILGCFQEKWPAVISLVSCHLGSKGKPAFSRFPSVWSLLVWAWNLRDHVAPLHSLHCECESWPPCVIKDIATDSCKLWEHILVVLLTFKKHFKFPLCIHILDIQCSSSP